MFEQIAIGVVIGLWIAWMWLRQGESLSKAQGLKAANLDVDDDVDSDTAKPSLNDLYAQAQKIEVFLNQTAHPRDLLENEDFIGGVEMLMHPDFEMSELVSYGIGDNLAIACMALVALKQRSEFEDANEEVIDALNRIYAWPLYFALRALKPAPGLSLTGAVISQAVEWWVSNMPFVNMLKPYLEEQLEQGDVPSFGERLDNLSSEQLSHIEQLLGLLGIEQLQPLTKEIIACQRTRVDVSALSAIGQVWEIDRDHGPIIEHPALKRVLKEMEATLLEAPRRSILLTGEPGVGKTTLYTVFAKHCQQVGWTIFEAGSTEILAGQSYVGQLEARMQELFKNLAGNRKVLWIIPSFHELLFAGWHRDNPRSVLDMLMPHLEGGDLKIIGETEPEAYERLIQRKPQIRAVLQRIQLHPMDSEESLAIARSWNNACREQEIAGPISEEILEEAFFLAQQYLDKAAAPGNLIDFLKLAQLTDHDPHDPLTIDDLYDSLSQLTGLPSNILDDREGLDLDGLKDLFQTRVLGQPEAVDCLVERVAMIKAGVNDPSRPAGVFLFVGPTGTGKTEIAKTLAEFLFGSSERMIRFDMSEFMSENSLSRLLGNQEDLTGTRALVNQIRKQPFSVILLDEFEKAHPNVWDLFLQVFDDGRLTDRRGNTADFRHSIIILTSNLGAMVPTGSHVGFSGDRKTFSASNVTRAVSTTFRPEFLNRIDRTVVFRPLSKKVVRDILLRELKNVLQRRGLRSRAWAVEWEDTALEFLLDKGFTTSLGARPLKRAIERYLLSPLAITIVKNQFPEGDQFLFVSSNGKEIQVEFIDPDQTEERVADAEKEGREEDGFYGVLSPSDEEALKAMILDPIGTPEEVDRLRNVYGALEEEVGSEEWQIRKADSLNMTSVPHFWNSDDRFAVLGDVEFQDRFERALDTAGSLLTRLAGEPDEQRASYSQVLIQRLAQRLFLLENAVEGEDQEWPRDVFLCIEPSLEEDQDRALLFAGQLCEMYVSWATKRKMRHKVLLEQRVDPQRVKRFVIAIAGLGAYPILQAESGIHVWEDPSEGKAFDRIKVKVLVAPQPSPPGDTTAVLLTQAEAGFSSLAGPRNIVRRYREEPSPLVRDSEAGWRTGRLDRVMEGDFDLIAKG